MATESGSIWIEAAIVCVLSGAEWLVSNVATRSLIRTYKFRAASKTYPPLRISVSRNPWHPFAEPWGSAEPSMRNTGLNDKMVLAQTWPLSLKYSKLPFLFSSNPTCGFYLTNFKFPFTSDLKETSTDIFYRHYVCTSYNLKISYVYLHIQTLNNTYGIYLYFFPFRIF
jgi:hypothetical protein